MANELIGSYNPGTSQLQVQPDTSGLFEAGNYPGKKRKWWTPLARVASWNVWNPDNPMATRLNENILAQRAQTAEAQNRTRADDATRLDLMTQHFMKYGGMDSATAAAKAAEVFARKYEASIADSKASTSGAEVTDQYNRGRKPGAFKEGMSSSDATVTANLARAATNKNIETGAIAEGVKNVPTANADLVKQRIDQDMANIGREEEKANTGMVDWRTATDEARAINNATAGTRFQTAVKNADLNKQKLENDITLAEGQNSFLRNTPGAPTTIARETFNKNLGQSAVPFGIVRVPFGPPIENTLKPLPAPEPPRERVIMDEDGQIIRRELTKPASIQDGSPAPGQHLTAEELLKALQPAPAK